MSAKQRQRELLEERWKVVMMDTQRFANEYGLSTVNSKRYRRVTDTLEEIGVLLVGEVSDKEYGDLVDIVASEIWGTIEDKLLRWAEEAEAARVAQRAA